VFKDRIQPSSSGRQPDLPTVSYANPADPFLRRLFIGAVEKVSGQTRLERLYHSYRLNGDKDRPFWLEALRRLDLTLDCDLSALARVPRTGPLVVVANHPFGVIDGLVLCHLASTIRPDIKLIAHEVMHRAPELRESLLPVSFTGTREARMNNIETCRRAISHVKQGGSLVIFPAGGVSTARNVFGPATDAPWQPFAARLMLSARATVLPIHFEGQNSWLFHAASRISERFREALLIHEAARRIATHIRLHIGAPISYPALAAMGEPEAMLARLRAITYGLRENADDGPGDCGGESHAFALPGSEAVSAANSPS
jgi:putative hemolysin